MPLITEAEAKTRDEEETWPEAPTRYELVTWPSMWLLCMVSPIAWWGRNDRPRVSPLSLTTSRVIWRRNRGGWLRVFLNFNLVSGECLASARWGNMWTGWSGTWWLRRNKTGTNKVLMVNVSTWQFAVKVTEAIYWCSAKATQRTLAEHAHVPLVTRNLPLRRKVKFGVTDIITITKYPTSDPWEELDWIICDLDAVGEWELV